MVDTEHCFPAVERWLRDAGAMQEARLLLRRHQGELRLWAWNDLEVVREVCRLGLRPGRCDGWTMPLDHEPDGPMLELGHPQPTPERPRPPRAPIARPARTPSDTASTARPLRTVPRANEKHLAAALTAAARNGIPFVEECSRCQRRRSEAVRSGEVEADALSDGRST